MFIEKLSLFGFKSFNQRTTVTFDQGISGVIGPNGCGKSNIVDAMRWVLGEQSSKQLRGAKMEDVIFNGTRQEKPLSLAQVELTINNDRGLLPVDYTTVTVGRRLYRSGHSEYLINGNEVRLKDVRDLFLDTGMGSHAYSVIERHMVDHILSDNTGHRRFLFEEAAGIMKYKTRKKEALNKLDATERDLTRVNDIISEVEKQVASLKRQVGKARRYKDLLQSIRDLDLSLSMVQRAGWRERLHELEQGWRADSQAAQEAETVVSGLEAKLEQLQLTVMEEERKLVGAREQLAQVEDEVGRNNNEMTAVRERIQAATQKIEESGDMQVRLQDRLERNGADKEEAARRLETLVAREARDQRELEAKDQERQAAEIQFHDAQSSSDASRQEAVRLLEAQVRLEAHSSALESRIKDLGTQIADLETRAREAASKRAALVAELEDLEQKLVRQRSVISGLDEKKQLLATELANHKSRVEIQRQERSHFRETEAAAKSRLETLESLRENYEGFDAGVRALVAQDSRPEGVVGTVSDLITIPAKWIRALEPVLAHLWQYVVIQDTAVGRKLLHRLESEDLGFAYLIPLDRVPASEPPQGDGVWASEIVEADSGHRDLVRYLLGDLVLTNDLDEALRAVESGAARRAVSKTGKFVDRTVLAGGGDGPQGSDLLEREEGLERCRQEIEQLGVEMARLSEREQTLNQEQEELQRRQETLEGEGRVARESLEELERDRHRLEVARQHLDESIDQLQSELSASRSGLEGDQREVQKAASQLLQISEEIREAKELEETHTDALVKATARRDTVLNELHEIKVEWARLEGDLKDCRATVERLDHEREDLGLELERAKRDQSEAGERKISLEASLENLSRVIQELHEQRAQRSQVVADLEREKAEAVAREHQDSDAVRSARREAGDARNRAHKAELELTQLKNDLEHLESRLREDYEIDLQELDALEVTEPPENAAEELGVLREKLRRLGPVNHMALEEYEEKKTRFDFMSSQRDDLMAAKDVLTKTIEEINKKASIMFMDTFSEVQAHFQKTFQVLFQGGECSLTLTGDDPLEADIDVTARPRGKRPQGISQLSSGERALTAIALLFAIYLVKPSPFCILDEVDAPLDDANIDRFVAMIKEFSKRTQFIMITHNKKTMEAADCLYGVTMQRAGISSLVSVRLDGGNSAEADAALRGALESKPAGGEEAQDNGSPAVSAETTIA